MSYKDFRGMWDQLEICNLGPHALEDCSERNAWQVKQVEGKIRNIISDLANFSLYINNNYYN